MGQAIISPSQPVLSTQSEHWPDPSNLNSCETACASLGLSPARQVGGPDLPKSGSVSLRDGSDAEVRLDEASRLLSFGASCIAIGSDGLHREGRLLQIGIGPDAAPFNENILVFLNADKIIINQIGCLIVAKIHVSTMGGCYDWSLKLHGLNKSKAPSF